jgi:succinylglutamate desuccinylase
MNNTLLIDRPYILDSGEPGPRLLIIGGIHGDEICGVNAIREISSHPEQYSPSRGSLILVYGNPAAIEKNTRYIDEDLNRTFIETGKNPLSENVSLERGRMRQLRAWMNDSDVLLDIHASFTPESQPFIICERNALSITPYLPIDTVCFGFDSVQPGGTDWYMNSKGKIGICVECGYLENIQGTTTALNICRAVIAMLGMNQNQITTLSQQYFQATQQYFTRTDSFRLERKYADFERILKGTLFAKDGDQPLYAEENMCLLFARNRQKQGQEAFVSLIPIPPPPPSHIPLY